MDDFLFYEDMPEVKVTLTAGPSYFGSLDLAREASRLPLAITTHRHPDKLVIENRTNPNQEIGILLEIDHVGNDEIAQQLAATIHQTMMLHQNVSIKVMFKDVDVMLPDVSEYLAKAVVYGQKELRDWTDNVASFIMWY